ncbi:MAG: guanylate kinase [Vampirovibrionales bacterium]|nr:guanylate kinase [Vampirovibrionales bacterium]
MMPAVKKLIILSGPSGVGKGTVCKLLRARMPWLVHPVSLTTRAMREGEQDGREYFFVTREAFIAKRDAGELLESVEYNGALYGTPRAQIDAALAAGQTMLLEIDAEGALALKQLFADDAFLIFLAPPSLEVLLERLKTRGQNCETDIAGRLARAQWEMAQQAKFDAVVTNDLLERSVPAVAALIEAAACQTGQAKA